MYILKKIEAKKNRELYLTVSVYIKRTSYTV